MPLRIALICFPTVGGSGKIATDLGRTLARRGHSVHLLSYDRPGFIFAPEANLHVEKIAIPDYPLLHLSAYAMSLASQLAELSQHVGFDLWHLHYAIPHMMSAYLAMQLLRDRNAPIPKVVTTLHGTDVTLVGSDPALVPMHRFLLSQCDALTTPSAYLRDAAHAQIGIPQTSPIQVIPNFVDTEFFCPLRPSPSSAERCALLSQLLGKTISEEESATTAVLLHSSNFRPVKRIDDVIQLFVRVTQLLPEGRRGVLFLVGDGPEKPRMEALAESMGVAAAVRFLGIQHDFRTLLQHSDVFLLPSTIEGFGLSALEALSCGVPVVASRAGGLVEVVEDGKTGFLCPVGDVAAMADAVLRILSIPNLRSALAQNARRQVEERWQSDQVIDQYESLYMRILRHYPL